MKKLLLVLGGLAGLVVLFVVGGVTYLYLAFPKAGPPLELKAEANATRLERGEYLANHVSLCMDCHSLRDWDKFSGPLLAGSEGGGGEEFIEDIGEIFSANITPAAIGDWTDGELARAIVSGVSRDGRVLAPIMPYGIYKHMSKEDLLSVIAYVRTLSPVEKEVKQSTLTFPFSLIARTIPAPYEPGVRPPASDTIATGKYLTTIGGCNFCHTPAEQGQPLPGMDFAGGFLFKFPDDRGSCRSSNITPDMETGIGSWTSDFFVARFKAYADSAGRHIPAPKGSPNTVMPWTMYADMTEADLRAIYAYLRTVKPVKNTVERFTPASTP